MDLSTAVGHDNISINRAITCWEQDSGILKRLLDSGYNPNEIISDIPPLYHCAVAGFAGATELLLDYGAQVTPSKSNRRNAKVLRPNALIAAAEYKNHAVLGLLVRHHSTSSSDINSEWEGRTALSWACVHGSIRDVQLLLDHDADPWRPAEHVLVSCARVQQARRKMVRKKYHAVVAAKVKLIQLFAAKYDDEMERLWVASNDAIATATLEHHLIIRTLFQIGCKPDASLFLACDKNLATDLPMKGGLLVVTEFVAAGFVRVSADFSAGLEKRASLEESYLKLLYLLCWTQTLDKHFMKQLKSSIVANFTALEAKCGENAERLKTLLENPFSLQTMAINLVRKHVQKPVHYHVNALEISQGMKQTILLVRS